MDDVDFDDVESYQEKRPLEVLLTSADREHVIRRQLDVSLETRLPASKTEIRFSLVRSSSAQDLQAIASQKNKNKNKISPQSPSRKFSTSLMSLQVRASAERALFETKWH
jgi:hypothetical protein